MAAVDQILALAHAEVGYYEKASNASLYDKTANAGSGNYSKYAYEFDTFYSTFYNGKKNGFEWCDMFVDWLFVHTFGEDVARSMLCQPLRSAGAGCLYSYNYYKQYGLAGSTAQVGAQIFFRGSDGTPCHTGIVYKVDGSYVYTIEGNSSNRVEYRSYPIGSSKIYGYGYPRYSLATGDSTAATAAETTAPATPAITKEIYSPAKRYCNGSTDEPVYADTALTERTGSLNPYEECECIGMVNGRPQVQYVKDDTGGAVLKCGYVKWTGGVKD